jgi:hypothetical protein
VEEDAWVREEISAAFAGPAAWGAAVVQVGVMLRSVECHVDELITDPDPLGRTHERVYVGEQTPIAGVLKDAGERVPSG